MAHYIQGFVALLDELREAAVSIVGARAIELPLGFGFLPINERLASDDEPVPFESLYHLTTRLNAWATEQSQRFPLAYIETDYFGGMGEQMAVVWQVGKIIFGPDRSKSEWVGEQFVSPPLLDKAINRALRLLGVDRGHAIDEFDALGLGKHRSNKGWLSEELS